MRNHLSYIAAMLVACPNLVAADFPQFRGPYGTGIVASADPPTEWSGGKGIAWRTEIPGTGWSQPVIVGDTVFVSAAVGEKIGKPKDMQAGVRDIASMGLGGKKPNSTVKWQILALDAGSGSIKWNSTVAEGKPKYPIHPSNTYATETPCADAERVYAYFGASGAAAALDHQGNNLWKTELGAYPISNGFGSGSSPLLLNGRLYLNCFNEEKAFVVAIDAKSGKEVWRKEREKPGSSWASPIAWKNSMRTEVIACGDKLVTSHDPSTGLELWRLGGIGTAFAPSPAVDGDTLIFGASSPFSPTQMYAVRAGARGDVTLRSGEKSSGSVAWYNKGGTIGMASPVAAGGFVYWPSQGILTCYEVATGKQVYKERVGSGRQVTSSPLIVGDKLLLLSENGSAAWVKTGPKFSVVGRGEINDTFWATPAVVGDRLYLRGVDALYCLKK